MTNQICIHCGWTGDDSELWAKTDDPEDQDFIYCPDCKSVEFEDEDEEVRHVD